MTLKVDNCNQGENQEDFLPERRPDMEGRAEAQSESTGIK